MTEDKHEQQPTHKTQLTRPKKGAPIEIPVPKEDDFEKLVRRAVPHRPASESDTSGGADD